VFAAGARLAPVRGSGLDEASRAVSVGGGLVGERHRHRHRGETMPPARRVREGPERRGTFGSGQWAPVWCGAPAFPGFGIDRPALRCALHARGPVAADAERIVVLGPRQ
jgi:hypothetical protein